MARLPDPGEADATRRGDLPRALDPGHDEARERDLYSIFCRLGQALVSSFDLDDLLNIIVEQAVGMLRADVALLRLLDRPGEHLELELARGVPEEVVRAVRFKPGEGLAGRVLLDGRPLRGINLQRDPRATQRAVARRYGWKSFAAVPIHLHQQPIGVWFLIRRRRDPFDDAEVDLLTTFANYASLAVERSWLFHTIVQDKHESEAVVAASASGILVVDHRGRVVDMNPAFERLTGWTLHEGRGQPCCDVVGCHTTAESKEHPSCPLLAAGAGSDRAFIEYRIHRRDGTVVPVEVSYGLIRDEDGELVRVVAVFRDISEQRELNRLRAEIVANVSHELRTPLALIKGYATTLLSPSVSLDRASARRFLHNVSSAADHLGQMIDDLLAASRLEAEQLRLEPDHFELATQVRDVLDWFGPHAPELRLVADLPPEELWVWADPQRVHQVLFNLLSNAVKYSPPGSTVYVRGRRLGDPPRAVVHVIDEGDGIAPEHLPYIFDQFYLTERSKKGIGLGLYICKGLVEAMGGRIWVVSELGQGSTFSFTLPVEVPEPA
ncbi:MAG: ATP-binding protein [Anaerolineae bacterium]|jgi:PAS domain S-box-containing protein